jgi:hypothetical protein
MISIRKMYEWLCEKIMLPFEDRFSGADEEQWVKVPDTPEGKLWQMIELGECPDCHHFDGFLEGPSGGLSTNIICINCRHRFNVTPMIGIAERIPMSDNDADEEPAYVEGTEDGGEG